MTKRSRGAARPRSAIALRAVAPGALLAVVLAASAHAHGAAPPPDQYKRELADCVDDWFGSDGGGASSAGYDMHALDVRELWDPALGNAIAFRIIANGVGPVEMDVQSTLAGETRHLRMTTQNGETWASGDFARLIGPQQAGYADGTPDGPRFTIEGIVALSALGVSVGGSIADFRVESNVNGEPADGIPGYHTDALFPGQCESGDGAPFNPQAAFRLRGPVQYAAMPDADANCVDDAGAWPTQSLLPGFERFVDVWVCNQLRDQAQEFTLTVAPRDGFTLRFHEPGTGAYSDTATLAVPKGETRLVHLAVTADAGAAGSGFFDVTLDTDLGGRLEREVPYSVQAGGETTPAASPSNGSPAPAAAAALAIALVAAMRLQRR